MLTPTVAEINLAHLRHNVRVLKAYAGEAALMGVVKADAYGHGAIRAVSVLRQEGVHHFAVATVPEALQLREAGVADPILVFGAPLPDYMPVYARHNLDVTVASPAVAQAVAAAARRVGPLRVHIKVDTGMTRLGVLPEEAAAVVQQLQAVPEVTIAALWTHLATADEEDNRFAHEQLARFEQVRQQLPDLDVPLHTANSAALLTLPQSFRFNPSFVRPGIALYGLSNLAALTTPVGLRPVMRFTSRVTQVRTVPPGTTVSYGRRWRAERVTRIATVGAGYADGYPRLLTNRAQVGLRGRRYPVAGTVCMDMFMVDLGDPDGPGSAVEVGDEVVLFGEGGPSALEVAAWAETIPYEICCGVSARVPRRYVEAGDGAGPVR